MKKLQKINIKIFVVTAILVFFALMMTLRYSFLEVDSMPRIIEGTVNIVTSPAVLLSTIPSIFIVDIMMCSGEYTCPGFFDAYSTENGVVMLLISFFSAIIYGFLLTFIFQIIRKRKAKKVKTIEKMK